MRVTLSPTGERKKTKYNVDVLKKKKNVPKLYQLDDQYHDVEPYSPRYIAPETTTVKSDKGWTAPILNKDTFELSEPDSMVPIFGYPVVDVLTSVVKEQILGATFVPMPNCDYDETMDKYAVSFAKDVIPATTMEDVSPPGMEGKTIALTSHTVANEACDVLEPDIMLHWNDLELSTDSTEALVVETEPLSDILKSPLIKHVDAEKGNVLPRHVIYRKSEDGKGIKNKISPMSTIGQGESVDNPTLTGGVKVKPVAVTLLGVQHSKEELKSLIASTSRNITSGSGQSNVATAAPNTVNSTNQRPIVRSWSTGTPNSIPTSSAGRMSANITMLKTDVLRSRPDLVEEVLPAANPNSVTTNTSRSVPINYVTTISISQATRGGPSVIRTVTSSTTRMSSTVSSSLVNKTLLSARYSPRKRSISFASHHDRVKGIHHHTSGRLREESPRPLNTNFRIPLLSRENERRQETTQSVKWTSSSEVSTHPLCEFCTAPSRRTQLWFRP